MLRDLDPPNEALEVVVGPDCHLQAATYRHRVLGPAQVHAFRAEGADFTEHCVNIQ